MTPAKGHQRHCCRPCPSASCEPPVWTGRRCGSEYRRQRHACTHCSPAPSKVRVRVRRDRGSQVQGERGHGRGRGCWILRRRDACHTVCTHPACCGQGGSQARQRSGGHPWAQHGQPLTPLLPPCQAPRQPARCPAKAAMEALPMPRGGARTSLLGGSASEAVLVAEAGAPAPGGTM